MYNYEIRDESIIIFYSENIEDGVALNYKLAKQRNISIETLRDIAWEHKHKNSIINRMIQLSPKNKIALRAYASQLTDIEFRLQKLWGFPEDKSYHPWYMIPHCSCPTLDNEDRIGTEYQIVSSDCPIHAN